MYTSLSDLPLGSVHEVLDWHMAAMDAFSEAQNATSYYSYKVIHCWLALEEGLAYGLLAGKQEDVLIQVDVRLLEAAPMEEGWGKSGKLLLHMPLPAGGAGMDRSTSDYLHCCRDGTLILSRRPLRWGALGGADIWVLRDGLVLLEHHFKPDKQRHNMHNMSSHYVDTCISLSACERYLYAYSGTRLLAMDLDALVVTEKIIDDNSSCTDGIHAFGNQVVIQRYSWDFQIYNSALKAGAVAALTEGACILTFSYVPEPHLPYEVGNLGGFAYRVLQRGEWEIKAVWGIRYEKPINDWGYVSDFAEDFRWAQHQVGDRFWVAFRQPHLDGKMHIVQIMNDLYTKVDGTWSFDELYVVEFPSLRHVSLDLRLLDPDLLSIDYNTLRYHFRADGRALYLYAGLTCYAWEFDLAQPQSH